MRVLWVALAIPAVLVLCWSDQLIAMAMNRWFRGRDDDKAARRRDTNVS